MARRLAKLTPGTESWQWRSPETDLMDSDMAHAFIDLHYDGVCKRQGKTGDGDKLLDKYQLGFVLRGVILLWPLAVFYCPLLPGHVTQVSLLLPGLLLTRN